MKHILIIFFIFLCSFVFSDSYLLVFVDDIIECNENGRIKNIAGSIGEINRSSISSNFKMAIFEIPGIYSINYVIDPKTLYMEISESNTTIDFLQFPIQTLIYFKWAYEMSDSNSSILVGLAKENYEFENYGTVRQYYTKLETIDPELALKYDYLITHNEGTDRASYQSNKETMEWDE